MQRKKKIAIQVLIILIIISTVFFPLYSAFNYYPTIEEMEEGLSLEYIPLTKIGQLWAILQNQRVSLNTEVPATPTDRLPIFQGNASSSVLYVDFVDSIEECGSSADDICFLVTNHNITKTSINTGRLNSIEQVRIDYSYEHILHQVKNGNFVTDTGDYPMSPLGRVKIVDVELVYFDLFDYYPYGYKGETTYYPAWKMTAETSNYGDEVIMIKAMGKRP